MTCKFSGGLGPPGVELLQSARERNLVAAGREKCSLLSCSGLDGVFQTARLGHASVALGHPSQGLVSDQVDDAHCCNVHVGPGRFDLEGKAVGGFAERFRLSSRDGGAHVWGLQP